MNDELLQQGQVSERNYNNASCRVAMDDLETPDGVAMESDSLQVLFPAVDHWNFMFLPKEGDHVATARLPNGTSEGYVLGKPYTADNMPQGGAEGVFLMVSSDGKNVVRLDAVNGTMEVIFNEKAILKFKKMELLVKNDAVIKVEGNAVIEAAESAVVRATEATIEAANVVITGGELETKGTVAPTGDGPYCAFKHCIFSNAVHTGSKVSGT